MADADRPLSRRERRELEERAAGGVPSGSGGGGQDAQIVPGFAPTAATPVVSEAEQDKAVSRRDRRRLERIENPVETWTAEEEMRHTGQIPTMTPEVIAQQEALAREKAAAAQRDAELATGSIPTVKPTQVKPAAVAEATGGPPQRPGPEPAAPEAESRYPEMAAYGSDDQPRQGDQAAAPAPGAPPGLDELARLAQQAAAGVGQGGPQSQPQPQPGPQLFDQARAPQQASPPPPPQSPGPAAPGAPSFEIPSFAEPTPFQGVPVQQGAPQAPQGPPGAPGAPGAPGGPQQAGAPAQGVPPAPGVPQAPSEPFPLAPVAPNAATAAGAPGAPPPPPGQAGPYAPPGAPGGPQAKPPTQPVPQVMQPGMPVPAGAMVVGPGGPAPSPYAPGGAPMAPQGPTTGMMRMPGSGQIRTAAGPMTGTIPRPVVEVQPAGGAREFGWPHIAVLAAVAFTLGIVVWTVAGSG